MPTVTCVGCGRSFPTDGSRTRFCDLTCYRAWRRTQGQETVVSRFWAKVNREGPPPAHRPDLGPCWLWTAAQIRGYGQFHLSRQGARQQAISAHRFVYALTNGPIARGLSVLHKCDTPLCVRPDHLFLGSQADNLNDARAKGRLVDGRHRVKVSDAGLAYIRASYRPRINGKQLAAQYGISLTSLMRIMAGTQRVQPVFPRVDPVRLRRSKGRAVHAGQSAPTSSGTQRNDFTEAR